METYYNVFVRNWWRWETSRFNTGLGLKSDRKLVPDPGARKTYLAKHVTYADARELCDNYRAQHDPGPLSRKAEFEQA